MAFYALVALALTPGGTRGAGTPQPGDPAMLQTPPPAGAVGYPSRAPDLDALPGFRDPPPGYGEVPFWWWTGDPLDEERLRWQLDELHRHGVSGVQVNYAHEDSPGWPTYAAEPPIFGEAWWRTWGRIADECRQRGMGIGLSTYTLDWPAGNNLFRQFFYSKPELNALALNPMPRQRVRGGQAVAIDVPPDLVAARACRVQGDGPSPDGVDLMPQVRDRRLAWTTPEGEWELWLVRGERQPNTLNPLLAGVGEVVVRDFYQRFQDATPDHSPAGLNYFFNDELHIGAGTHVWNDDLAAEFLRRKGYDLLEVLPALWTDLGPRTPKVRLDYADVRMALMEERYFQPIYRWHASRGLIFACDSGGRGLRPDEFGDYFRATRWYTAPGHDTPGGHADLIKGKVSSSIATLYGRPRVWLEGYHSLGWGATPERLMLATRENYLYGCTLLNLHGLYYSTHGSFWEWAPPCYHFRMPYWEHMGLFLKYFERLSYLMSQGVHQGDVAVFYPVSPYEAQMGGQEATEVAFAAGRALFQAGYDFVFMDADSLARAEVRDGRLHIAGAAYRVLVLPALRAARWTTVEKAGDFCRQGGIVLAVGALPEASDRAGREDPVLDAAVKGLFGATAAEVTAGARPPVQGSPAGGVGLALLPDRERPPRQYEGGFVGRWAWAREPVQDLHAKAVWHAAGATPQPCRIRFLCDNEGALYVNDTRLCQGADYTAGWTGEATLEDGDVITVDARDHDVPGRRCTAGLFLAVVVGGQTRLSTLDLRYTLTPSAAAAWRTDPAVAGLQELDPTNVHELHLGPAQAGLADQVVAAVAARIPRDVQAQAPAALRAAHRRVGPRDVYLVMDAPKGTVAEFRAKGQVELWDPWTGETKPLRVLGETATGTQVELPLEPYEAQIVVFTPGRPHVNPPPLPERPLRRIALDGEWEVELKPTLDNRFGDFRLPVTEPVIGPEARIFRHALAPGDTNAWQAPGLDDSTWERVTHGYGPQFWLLGPVASEAAGEALEAELAGLRMVDPGRPVTVAGQPVAWRPYSFSWRLGREGDPGHQGWHGLKENVSDHFLCLGKPEQALNETAYGPEIADGRYYLWTSLTVAEPTTVRIEASARREGLRPHASEVLTPAAVFLNGAPVAELQQALALRPGANPLLVRYDQAGRGYFVVRRQGPPAAAPAARTPLAMRWCDDPAVVPFDVHAGARPAEWFRFVAPPGLQALAVTAKGTVEAWADGTPMRSVGAGRFEAAAALPRAAVVALRVMPETGRSGGAALPEPVRLECGPGLAGLGDWSKAGVLECYSGAVWYRKTVTLSAAEARAGGWLDLGRVVATAAVRVNGQTAVIRVAPPWRVEVSECLVSGENRIEVLVCNTLANHYLTIPTHYRGETVSGLLGPVTLEVAAEGGARP